MSIDKGPYEVRGKGEKTLGTAQGMFGDVKQGPQDAAARKAGHVPPRAAAASKDAYVQDIEALAIANSDFRRVLYTARHSQLVLMALKPGEEIGAEVHTLDQFFRVEAGTGVAVIEDVRTAIAPGFAVLVPSGTRHNIVNTGSGVLKLYTLYSPPNHRDGVVHPTRADAEADTEHFDGVTTRGH